MSENTNLKSSLKYFNFDGLTTDEVITKFDNLLFRREQQIQELSNDLCTLNDKLNLLNSFNKQLEKEKQENSTKINKLEKNLNQELTDKEILLSKNSKLEADNNHLIKQLSTAGAIGNFNNTNNSSTIASNTCQSDNKSSKKSSFMLFGGDSKKDKEKEVKSSVVDVEEIKDSGSTSKNSIMSRDIKDKYSKTSKSKESYLSDLDKKILSVSMIDGNNSSINKDTVGKLASETIDYQPLFD